MRPEPAARDQRKHTHRYRGATAVAAIDAPHSRPGDSILRVPKGWLPDCGFGDDAPRVRRPTCRCVYGRPPLLASAADQDEDETDDGLCAPPPPPWKPTKETLDLEALIAADGRAPRFEESVDLWRDDLDPHSFGFFRVRVRAHERFWVAYSRFFIRVRVPRLLPLLDGASMAWRRRDEGAVPEKRTRDKKPSRGQRRQWKPTKETLDLEALIAADGRAPLFEESVDLWRDDLDPHSFGFFRVRVRAHERFWVAYSRFFIRVNGVRARVIDARFAGFGDRVLRERSWREGDWTAVAGAGAPPCVDLGGLLRRPANTSRFHAIDATPRRKKREDKTTKHAQARATATARARCPS